MNQYGVDVVLLKQETSQTYLSSNFMFSIISLPAEMVIDSPWDSLCTTEENSQQIYYAITNSHTRLEDQHKNRISIESPTLLSYELHTSLSVLQPKELSSCLLFAASYPPPSTRLHYDSH